MREEKNKKSSHKVRKVIHLTKKRWLYPALYVAFAAVLVSSVLVYQLFLGDNTATKKPVNNGTTTQNEPSVPASSKGKGTDMLKKPVGSNVDIQKKFYDESASEADQEQAIVQNGTTYTTNAGVDFASKDGKTFDVTAALSGTIVKAEKDALLGYVVHIQHNDQVMTYYQSLESVSVEEGMTVKQGDVLGKAGRSVFNKDAGIHAHFEVRNDGVAVNPESFFGKKLADISKTVEEPVQSTNESTTESTPVKPANPGSDNGADMNSGNSEEKKQSSTDSNSDEILTDNQKNLKPQFFNSQQ
ncbi:MAG: peptidoglycan DD-metalloendopeptidase family protein [Bacillaceae bacterium]